jgi:hypothetical protein
MAQSQKNSPQALQVPAEQQPIAPTEPHRNGAESINLTDSPMTGVSAGHGEPTKSQTTLNDHNGRDEGYEFWTIFGRRIKITDTLFAVFTVLLLCATVALWWSTRGLINSARETTEQQLRAYVTMETGQWRGLTDGRPLASEYGLVAYGPTPARKAQLTGTIAIHPYPLPPKYALPPGREVLRQPTAVFPGTHIPNIGWIQANETFTPAEIAEVTSPQGARRIYLYGQITYEDVFGIRRETFFRFYLDPESITRDSNGGITGFNWAVAEDGNDFR